MAKAKRTVNQKWAAKKTKTIKTAKAFNKARPAKNRKADNCYTAKNVVKRAKDWVPASNDLYGVDVHTGRVKAYTKRDNTKVKGHNRKLSPGPDCGK